MNFLTQTKTTVKKTYKEHAPYFASDKEARDIWTIRLQRGRKAFTFTFGQSQYNQGQEPTDYELLACLDPCGPGTHAEFCRGYDYDEDSRNGLKIYKELKRQAAALARLYTVEELEQLTEIN
jgi:hypothetical protein